MYARTKAWDLGDVTVDVDYDHHSTPRLFQVDIRLSGELSDLQLERLEKVAAACPLRRSIETGIEFEERIQLRREASPRRIAADRVVAVPRLQGARIDGVPQTVRRSPVGVAGNDNSGRASPVHHEGGPWRHSTIRLAEQKPHG
jgi:hypothetical protein